MNSRLRLVSYWSNAMIVQGRTGIASVAIQLRILRKSLEEADQYEGETYVSTVADVCTNIRGQGVLLRQLAIAKRGVRIVDQRAERVLLICHGVELMRASSVLVETAGELEMSSQRLGARGKRQPPYVDTSLHQLTTEAILRHEEFARSRGVRLVLSRPIAGDRICVIRSDVRRAIGNLIHNAIKYSWGRKVDADYALVSCTVATDAQNALLTVQNRGVAITRNEIESGSLFEMFRRGAQSGDRGRTGTGIGLADSYEVAQAHDGSLTITSEAEGDWDLGGDDSSGPYVTTATLYLPLNQRSSGGGNGGKTQ